VNLKFLSLGAATKMLLVVLRFRSSHLNVPRVLANFGIGPLATLFPAGSFPLQAFGRRRLYQHSRRDQPPSKTIDNGGHCHRPDFLFAALPALVHVQSEQYCSDTAECTLLSLLIGLE
jgi:hypothetical protein